MIFLKKKIKIKKKLLSIPTTIIILLNKIQYITYLNICYFLLPTINSNINNNNWLKFNIILKKNNIINFFKIYKKTNVTI